jgi:hypothetical protein
LPRKVKELLKEAEARCDDRNQGRTTYDQIINFSGQVRSRLTEIASALSAIKAALALATVTPSASIRRILRQWELGLFFRQVRGAMYGYHIKADAAPAARSRRSLSGTTTHSGKLSETAQTGSMS